MAATTHTNVKKLLLPTTMSKSGWAIVEAREDVQGIEFAPTISNAEFHALLEDAAGIALGVRRFSDPELDAAPQLQVVSRIGVGYDEVDVPALNKRKVPLMIGGTSNSVSVAEAGVFLTMSLARKGASMDALVKEGRWADRYKDMPVDLYGKTVLIIGFGKIGTRSARRFAAMETNVLVYDPTCIRRRSAAAATNRCSTSTRPSLGPTSSRSIARRRRKPSACSTPPGSPA
jgi:D-3-phosphoglycerate dehydrogenase